MFVYVCVYEKVINESQKDTMFATTLIQFLLYGKQSLYQKLFIQQFFKVLYVEEKILAQNYLS